jgi:adenylyltransferase/sulfurtransferase
METIQILTTGTSTLEHSMLLYDAMAAGTTTVFHQIQKPNRKRIDCPVCGNHPTIRSMQDSQHNLLFLHPTRGPSLSSNTTTIDTTFGTNVDKDKNGDDIDDEPHVLLDVRAKKQFELCALPGAINIPLDELPHQFDRVQELSNRGEYTIYCLCRRGIASLEATRILRQHAKKNHTAAVATSTVQDDQQRTYLVRNIRGGLNAWRKDVDPSFPKY